MGQVLVANRKRLVVTLPGRLGYVSDVPEWAVKRGACSVLRDCVWRDGVLHVRRGWDYDGSTADNGAVASNAVIRVKFVAAAVTRTFVFSSGGSGGVFNHNAAAVGDQVDTGSVFASKDVIFRGVYRDAVWACCQDGFTPAGLFSGTITAGAGSGGTSYTAGQSIVTAATSFGAGAVRATYANLTPLNAETDWGPAVWPRVAHRISSTVLGIEDIKATVGGASAGGHFGNIGTFSEGHPYPCVNIYEEGTVTLSAGVTATVTGGDWSTINTTTTTGNDPSLLIIPASPAAGTIINYDASSWGASTTTIKTSRADANSRYNVLARCPFKDIAAFKNSLFGVGVREKPGVVFVSPPNWNPAFPPGFILPFDPSIQHETASGDPDIFRLDEINVPARYDGDPIVAVLETPVGVLVLKSRSVYLITGSYPSFDVKLLMAGDGCIDIRSAQSGPEGAFFAGRSAAYMFDGTRLLNITEGKVGREYRDAVRTFDASSGFLPGAVCSAGYLLQVALAGSGGNFALYDPALDAWFPLSLASTGRYIYTSRIQNEAERVFLVGFTNGRVVDLGPSLFGKKSTGAAADALDDDNTVPDLAVKVPMGVGDLGPAWRGLTVELDALVQDSASASSLAVALLDQSTSGGGGTLGSTTGSSRQRRRYRVGLNLREPVVQVTKSTLASTLTDVQLHQVAVDLRPLGARR